MKIPKRKPKITEIERGFQFRRLYICFTRSGQARERLRRGGNRERGLGWEDEADFGLSWEKRKVVKALGRVEGVGETGKEHIDAKNPKQGNQEQVNPF